MSQPNAPDASVADSVRAFAHGPRVIRHPSVAERRRRGRDARRETPRSSLGDYEPASDRPDPVDLLQSQAADRVASLMPIRYGRMLQNPFAYFRGAALGMASDLAAGPRTSLEAQLCGDAHVANFGAFGSPERRLVFDVNDFDETHPGPFEWDVKRLVASVELAARDNGYPTSVRTALTTTTAQAYRMTMVHAAEMSNLDAWYEHLDMQALAARLQITGPKSLAKVLVKDIKRAKSRNSAQVYRKLVSTVGGQARIVPRPPLILPIGDLVDDAARHEVITALRPAYRAYRHSLQDDRRHLLEGFEFVDLAHKVVGVGSVGTRCWIMLLRGRDDNDPLVLQIKQAGPSVLERFTQPSVYRTSGERVVQGQRRIQVASDVFLGWIDPEDVDGHAYYVRQLRDWKFSTKLPSLTPGEMRTLVSMCAVALAHAHARSGDRVAMASYLGSADPADGPNTFDRAMARFAAAYADQSERDFKALRKARRKGRISASLVL